jgi:hypothetical protein
MKRYRLFFLLVCCLSSASLTFAQTAGATPSALPRLVRFGGTVKDVNGNPPAGVVGITFALYSEQTGGAPLWLETQNVTADSNGRYTALLGATKPDGLPAELFTSEQARWVGVQVQGQPEQPRVLLVSAPYALKAGDAETIGGLPPSAFVLAEPPARASATASGAAATVAGSRDVAKGATDVTTTGGAANYLPFFTGTSTILDSVVYQTGTGSTANIGINTTAPTSTLDVQGTGTFSSSTSNGVNGASSAVNESGVFGNNSATSGASNGVYGVSASPSGSGTVGVNSSSSGHGVFGKAEGTGSGASGVYGNATSSSTSGPTYGVYGTTASGSAGSAGVYGTAPNSLLTGGRTYGVYGTSYTFSGGAGVFGGALTISNTGSSYGSAGVWGDGGTGGSNGVLATADDGYAVEALNNTSTDTLTPALGAFNFSTTPAAIVFQASGAIASPACTINNLGDLVCAGTIAPSVRTDDGRDVKLYGVAASENWFEDFGSGQLSGGSVRIALDAAFGSTVNTGEAYHVFLTARGDCKGLYVGAATASGFEVRELGGGTSNISFDYRIVAKRRGYESVRLEDVTDQMNKLRQHQAEMRARRAGRKNSAHAIPAIPGAPTLKTVSAPSK